MEKIFYAIMLSLFVSLISTPGLTCSRQDAKENVTENVTGAACSIAELNSMSKYKYAQENSVTGPPSARDLRPVKLNSSGSIGDGVGDCKLGLCIIEKIYSRP